MLYFITHRNGHYDEISGTRAVLEGGCRLVQLRIKDVSDDEYVDVGRCLRRMCSQYDARLIVDDRVHLVRDIDADGVHLGKKDMPVDKARNILGPGYIIGGTANTFDDILALTRQGVDYIGLGPFRFTSTKKNLSPVLGIEGYKDIMDGCRRVGIDVPVYAIGGITIDDIPAIMQTGVVGIALSGALLQRTDIVEHTKEIIKEIWKN